MEENHRYNRREQQERKRILSITKVGTNGEEENSRYNRSGNKWRGKEY